MSTLLIIISLAVIATIVGFAIVKSGAVKDEDGDLIPDALEDKIEDAMEDLEEARVEFKERVKKVLKEARDVINALKGKASL